MARRTTASADARHGVKMRKSSTRRITSDGCGAGDPRRCRRAHRRDGQLLTCPDVGTYLLQTALLLSYTSQTSLQSQVGQQSGHNKILLTKQKVRMILRTAHPLRRGSFWCAVYQAACVCWRNSRRRLRS